MAGELFFYDVGQEGIMAGTFNLVSSTIKAMLVDNASNAETRVKATIADVADITSINTTADTARMTLTGKSVGDNASGNTTKWDSSLDVVFANVSGGPILGLVIYWFNTNGADSLPIVYMSGSIFPITTTGDDITIKFNASGIGTATASGT